MRDEDFVLGYVTGFNDGVGSGGSSGGEYSDIVIYKQYDFGSSGYGIAIPDFTKGNRFIMPYTMRIENTDYNDYNYTNLSAVRYGPVCSWEIFPLAACMTYNGQVRGFFTPGNPDSYYENYSYVDGSFKLNNEKFSPSLVSAQLYKNGTSIDGKVEYKLSENGSVKSNSRSVLAIYANISLSMYYAPTGHGGDEFFRAWAIAYIKNGITGICDPINPYAK